jgi:hypothetical protein
MVLLKARGAVAEQLRDTWRSAPVSFSLVVGLFAGVTVLRWFIDRSGQAAALLYVLPITLGALRFGRRGAAGAVALGTLSFVVMALVHGRGDLDLTGWSAPPLSMALVGYLAARLEGLVGAHTEHRRYLEEVREAQHATLTVSDSIVQQVAAARWMLEAGRADEAAEVLNGTVAEGIEKLAGGLSQYGTQDLPISEASTSPRGPGSRQP